VPPQDIVSNKEPAFLFRGQFLVKILDGHRFQSQRKGGPASVVPGKYPAPFIQGRAVSIPGGRDNDKRDKYSPGLYVIREPGQLFRG
jgi:hypothetical protein